MAETSFIKTGMEILVDLWFNICQSVKTQRMLTCNVLKYPFWISKGKREKESLQVSALYFKEFDKLEK